MAEQEVKNKRQKRVYVGEVISDKMDKTVVVKTTRTYTDDRFHKVMRTFKKYKVHDENEQAKLGDIVEFHEGRPVSKTKYMYLMRVVNANVK
jgi:small subunit ribosomal protein S17